MAKSEEDYVAELLSQALGVQWNGSKKRLGKWGEADGWAAIAGKTLFLLEVEGGQKHPCTNVLKVWPFLEGDCTFSRVILAQVFFPDSPGLESNRGALCLWLGERMEKELGNRFTYVRLVVTREGEFLSGLEEIRGALRSGRIGEKLVPP